MLAPALRSIPAMNLEAARMHFEYYDHVHLSGLVDAALLEPALAEARQLTSPLRTKTRDRETAAQLRTPDPRQQPALTAVLQTVQNGAVLLGQSVMPVLPGEAYQIELREMERGAPAIAGQYRDVIGAVAVVNLRGQSHQRISGEGNRKSADYQIEPGDVVIHGLHRQRIHRDYTSNDDGRIGLAIATKLK